MNIPLLSNLRVRSFPPHQHILSRAERLKAQTRHDEICHWADSGNLTEGRDERFAQALAIKNYGAAYMILQKEFHARSQITLWQRRKWDLWIKSIRAGFQPS